MGDLTSDFSEWEFRCHPQRLPRHDRDPVPAEYMDNLRRLATAMQHARALTDTHWIITSGYRTPEHNEDIGGAPTSHHLAALGADFIPLGKNIEEVADLIEQEYRAGKMECGELITYADGHIHMSVEGPFERLKK